MPETSSSELPSPATKKWATFLLRSRSTAWLWLLFGAALVSGNALLFYLIILALTVSGMSEFFHLLHMKRARGDATVTIALSVAYVSAFFWSAASGRTDVLGTLDLGAVYLITVAGFLIHMTAPVKEGQSHVAVMSCVFGFIYAAFLFNFVTRISWFDDGMPHEGEVKGRTYMLFLLGVTKFTDMGAYVVGSLIGRHKMAPHLSPGKTWEGFAGAVVFAYLAAFGITWAFPRGVPLLTPIHTAILALLLSLGAILGDLAESTLKRSLRAKDSGQVMPGIGGILDLIDSIIFTAPILYFYLKCLHP